MYCLIVLPFYLSYLKNEKFDKCLFSTSKPTLMTPIISSIYGLNIEKKIFDRIIYAVNRGDAPR
jgi:hypothetical protein